MSQALGQSQVINQWLIEEINAVVKASDADDFASEEEVLAVINKWNIMESS